MLESRGPEVGRLGQSARPLLNDEYFVAEEGNASCKESHLLANCPNRMLRTKQILSDLVDLRKYLLPSFLRPCAQIPTSHFSSLSPFSHQSTAYLSGLRGVASVIVFIYHFAHGSYPGIDHAYGDSNSNRSIFQLPIVRLFYSAEAMVALFFLISGYSLSHRCMIHIRARNADRAYAVVSSLAFRRAMRLYLPALASSLFAYLAQRAGWMPDKGLPDNFVPGLASDTRLYIQYLGNITSVWTWEANLDGLWYNPHLWTIPVEFRCSMVLFLLINTTARFTTQTRLLVDIILIAYCMLGRRWDLALFIMGKLLAELSAINEETSELEYTKIEGEESVQRT